MLSVPRIMLTRVLLLISLASLGSGSGAGSNVLRQFQRFKADHGKSYSAQEEQLRLVWCLCKRGIKVDHFFSRFNVFQRNLRKIEDHNSRQGELLLKSLYLRDSNIVF